MLRLDNDKRRELSEKAKNRARDFSWDICAERTVEEFLPIVVTDDVKHSHQENRYYALGHKDTDRLLFIVFTIRIKKIRVISARNMSRKEREVYHLHEKENA